MKGQSLEDQVRLLDLSLPLLELRRGCSALANDVYEAAVYWRNLGNRALERDSRVNYPKRAQEERAILARLSNQVNARERGDKEYIEVFEIAQKLLDEVAAISASQDGYLGLVTTVKTLFSFLPENCGFKIRGEEPTRVRYSSGAVYIELQYSADPVYSCSFGPDDNRGVSFWIDDLLYLYGDERYRMIREQVPLRTRDEVYAWFARLAAIWKQHGNQVLINQPGIFDRLAVAQASRDKEWARAEGRPGG